MESRAEVDAIKTSRRLDEVGTSRMDAEILARKPVYTITLLVLMAFLLIAGGFNLYSASGGGDLFFTHMKHMSVALVLFTLVVLFIRPKHLNASAYWIYGGILVMLIGVLVIGQIGGGSRRWLTFGPINGQPSELAKIAVAIITARFFSEVKLSAAFRLRDLWLLGLMVGALFLLIFPQPDLGTASFLCLIVCAQLCFIPIEWKSIAMVGTTGAIILPVGWHFFLHDYQKDRILSFMDPSYDVQGKGYNILQSLIAIGSGGMNGKGFMHGTQTHLRFLPMSHSDFIFSVFAEEHGFLGGSLLLLSFAAIGSIALLIARESKTTFSALLAIGLGAFLFIEFAINVAMVLRMFPVKGLPLPFFSFGGSNLITSCVAIGILIAIDRDNRGRSGNRQLHVYKN